MTGCDNKNTSMQDFWGHLDVLRHILLRIICVVGVLVVVAFCFKGKLFEIVLAPQKNDFCFYRLLGGESFDVDLINTQLASQFTIHVKVASCMGILLAAPYIIYQLFVFISPALYANERRYAVWGTLWGYLLFMMGVLLSYFVIFPLTFRFLSTYQVSDTVVNTITLSSYVDTLMMLSLMMGLIFEIPLLSWIFAKLGFLTSTLMQTYRRHVVVVVFALAAVITPTSDIFTLIIVSLPIYVLYEISILVVRRAIGTRN